VGVGVAEGLAELTVRLSGLGELKTMLAGVGEGEDVARKDDFERTTRKPANPKQRTIVLIRIPLRIFVLYMKLLLLTFRFIFG
jgi:hypothetical protein